MKTFCTALFCLGLFFYTVELNAQKKSEVAIDGLNSPVEVIRDQWGVNHIYAKNQQDLFFAQGYLAAKDRLFQFEMWRRQATGTLAEILGPKELKRDISARLFKYRGDLKEELNHYHPDGEAIITAYVQGVNAYIEEALNDPKKLPIEFQTLGILPGKWTPEVVISRHQGLKYNVKEELNTARAVAAVGPEKVKQLSWFHPQSPNLTLDTLLTKELLSKDILELYNVYNSRVQLEKDLHADLGINTPDTPFYRTTDVDGSNNWIISGKRTQSGYPIMANDPHRQISLPSLRYMVHLNAPGWNVIGGGEPTIPGVSIGHNQYGAWGLTIHVTDAEDLFVYRLNPNDSTEYWYKGKWKKFDQIKEKISIKGAKEKEVVLQYSVHGPVIYTDGPHHRAFAIKAGWLEPGTAPYLAALRYDQAKNWQDFREASKYNLLPAENMIWADKEGNIGWQVVGITPLRNHSSGMVPVPGDGRYDWQGYLDVRKRPHDLNPSKGFFASANQHNTPPDYNYPHTVGFSWSDDFRVNRINQVLSSDTLRTAEKEGHLQNDQFSIPAKKLVHLLENIAFDKGLANTAKQRLIKWDFILDQHSISAGIYNMWERELFDAATKKFVPKEIQGLLSLQLTKIISWLEAPEDHFGKYPYKGRDQFLKATFESAIDKLKTKLGNDIADWQYGQKKYKHVYLQNPISQLLPKDEGERYNLGPLPRGGNSFVPGVTGNADNQNHGATFRIITDLSDWDQALMINSPGQSADPKSPYYDNLFKIWQEDRYFPAYFSKEKVVEHADQKTLLKPL